MCPCQGCCQGRDHYDEQEAYAETHRRWVQSRVVSMPAPCAGCDRWVVVR